MLVTRVVGSPLYEKPEAAKFLDLERDYLLPPEAVANAMLALLTQPDKYKPGTILEVCHETEWREVSLLGDSGPRGPASSTSRKKDAIKDIQRFLSQEATESNLEVTTD
jgi:3-hydroxybutyrate dehydrogenase